MSLPTPPSRGGWTIGFRRGPIAPVDGVVFIDQSVCEGFHPSSVQTWVITSDASFTVEVETPKYGVYAADPRLTTNAGNANKMIVQRGRWNSLKITTTGNVHFIADVAAGAWQT